MSTPKVTNLLNGFSATTVIIFIVLATWYVRPMYDMVYAHDSALSKINAVNADLDKRLTAIEQRKGQP
jgi:hypothetical protein